MRYLTPVLFFSAAVGVFYYNGQDSGRILRFPFIEQFWPAAQGDPIRLTQATIGVLLALGIFTLVPRLIRDRSRRKRIEEAME